MKVLSCSLCGNTELGFVTSQLRRGCGKIYRCDKCDYEFLIKAARDENNFYENLYWQSAGPAIGRVSNYDEIFDAYVNFQGNRVKTLSSYLDLSKSVIEIGCSTGHFLFNIKDKVNKVVGLDFDKKALEKCGEKNQCQVIDGGIEQGIEVLDGELFDILCCFQVLEHIENLALFLENIKKLVKPNGIVYLEVPNLNDPLLSLYHVPAYQTFYYHEDHLHYFSEKSLKKLLNNQGFFGEYIFYQDYNMVNHLNWLSHGQPQKSCLEGLGDPVFHFKEGSHTVEIQELIKKFNREYLHKLSEIGFTDNLAFLGSFHS